MISSDVVSSTVTELYRRAVCNIRDEVEEALIAANKLIPILLMMPIKITKNANIVRVVCKPAKNKMTNLISALIPRKIPIIIPMTPPITPLRIMKGISKIINMIVINF